MLYHLLHNLKSIHDISHVLLVTSASSSINMKCYVDGTLNLERHSYVKQLLFLKNRFGNTILLLHHKNASNPNLFGLLHLYRGILHTIKHIQQFDQLFYILPYTSFLNLYIFLILKHFGNATSITKIFWEF